MKIYSSLIQAYRCQMLSDKCDNHMCVGQQCSDIIFKSFKTTFFVLFVFCENFLKFVVK